MDGVPSGGYDEEEEEEEEMEDEDEVEIKGTETAKKGRN